MISKTFHVPKVPDEFTFCFLLATGSIFLRQLPGADAHQLCGLTI